MRKQNLFLGVCLLLMGAAPAIAEVKCVPLGEDVLFFGGQTITLNYELSSSRTEAVTFSWHVAVKQTVIASREKTVELTADKRAETGFKLELPRPRAGSPLEMELLIKIDGRLVHRRPLKVVLRNPLERFPLPIVLFDPAGQTAAALAKSGVKHRAVPRESELNSARKSAIVVGEGVSWKGLRTLSRTLHDCLERDNRIVVLRPSEGELSLTTLIGRPEEKSGRLQFAGAEAYAKLIPEFARSSVYKRAEPPTTLKLVGTRTDVMLGLQDNAFGWWWMRYQPDHSRGRLAICTLPVISEWDEDPLPRYLLAALLNDSRDDE
jgi:hypothetical protein